MTRVLLALIAVVAAVPAFADPGGSYDAWLKHREAALKDTSLVRYYAFEGDLTPDKPIPNLAGKDGALSFSVVRKEGAPEETRQVIEGRWPGKKGVRLDQGIFTGERFEVPTKAFTVEAWCRVNGYGAHRGNAEGTNGTLLSAGSGYWDGWRVTMSYPDKTLGFEIGKPQPDHSVGVRTAPVGDRVWRHLAVSWDGRKMRIYVDGVVAAECDYAGDYAPPPSRRFTIGFADSGWGSVRLDVDEVAVHNRALSPEEILRAAHFWAPLPDAVASRFVAAEQALSAGDLARAVTGYRDLAEGTGRAHGSAPTGLAVDYVALARLRLAEALRRQNKPAEAAGELAQVVDMAGVCEAHRNASLEGLLQLVRQGAGSAVPRTVYEKVLQMTDLSPQDRKTTRIEIARGLRDSRNYAAAREQYAEIMRLPDLTPRELLNLRLELGDTCREAKDYATARAEFARIVAQADAPAVYRSLAQLRIAGTYLREKHWPQATAEYRKLQAMADAPADQKWEAGEKLREIERLKQGLPARDPAWSRVSLPKAPTPAVTLYVAPNGDDKNPGTLTKPLATLQGARDALRALKAQGGLPTGGAKVAVRGGDYPVKEALTLAAEDSGTEQSPIVYQAFKGETPRFTGAAKLSGFQPVTEAAVLARLPEEARGKVLQVDLRTLGITDLGEAAAQGKRPELYFDGKPMTLARWPNDDFVRVGELRGSDKFDVWGSILGNHDGKFTYDFDRPARWQSEKDVWLYGYWFWDWADGYQKVASLDTQGRVITLAPPYHGYGFRSGQRYYAINLLAEIDTPGEWYLDRENGVLYFWPPSDPSKATVEFPVLGEPFVEASGLSHVTFRGLTFEGGRTNGVVLKDSSHCLLAGCTLCRLGENGVVLDGGAHDGILGCDLYSLGRGGSVITGGDRKTLTPGGHFIENCHVYDFSRVYRTYTPAVQMNGCGNRVVHNLFNDSPHHAMRIEGNDHVIEYNEIHSVVYESDDQGGLDMFWNPSYRGNILRYNFWHHIGSGLSCGQAGIRLDDAISGTLIYGNVFYQCSEAGFGGLQIHGGKENVVDNNVFVDCKYAISFSPWGDATWKQRMEGDEIRKKTREEVDITQPPYSTRYPELAHLAENADANLIWRNLAYNCGAFTTRDRGVNDLVDNYATAVNPGFTDVERLRLQLADGAPAYDRLGLDPIPFAEIGLYEDEYRATWPVVAKVTEHYKAPQ